MMRFGLVCIFFVFVGLSTYAKLTYAKKSIPSQSSEQDVKLVSSLSLVSMEKELLGPIIDISKMSLQNLEATLPAKTGRTHPLYAGAAILDLVRNAYLSQDSHQLKVAREYLDWLVDSYPMMKNDGNSKIWQYNFSHNNLQPGWWSGMANSAIALALRAGYEVFQDPRYKINYELAMNGVILPVEENGSSIELSPDAQWLCEYVWPGMTRNDSYFVLNGKLMALLAVRVMANVTGSEKYELAYEKSLAGYKILKERFFQKNDKWSYYMLNPLTTEATHYAIYELTLFDALYKLTNDEFFLDDILRRRKIFMEEYPVYLNLDNNRLFFSLIGLPNPYYIDIFPVTIDFISDNKIIHSEKIENIFDKSIPLSQRAFLTGTIPGNRDVDSLIVKCFIAGRYVELYRGSVLDPIFSWPSSKPMSMEFDLHCHYDAECIDGPDRTADHITIKPPKMSRADVPSHYTNTQGRLIFDFKNEINIRNNKYIAFIVNSEEEINNIKFTIFDKTGNNTSRYYPALVSNIDNIILISFVGFNQIETVDEVFSKFHISIFTNSLNKDSQDDFNVVVKDVFLLKDNAALFSLLQDDNYFLVEKE